MNQQERVKMTKVRDIIRELRSIRREVGAKHEDFPFDRIQINNDLTSRSEVEALFHPSGFLMDRGTPVFVYIPDHTVAGYTSPREANKIHFYKCRTLQHMIQSGKFKQRYREVNHDKNRYEIDQRRWGRTTKQKVVLYPCQNCLVKVSYQCFHWQMVSSEKEKIVKNFDAKVAFALIRQQFEIFRQEIESSRLSPASLPAGYPSSWQKISREYRRSKDYACEQCGVRLQHAPECLDVHHKDYDKQNILNSNLICLCKCCHAEQHKHYRLPDRCKHLVKQAQRSQKAQRTCP